VIEARGLTRRFGTRVAVEDVSLSVGAGQLCALLGPNGAGKTTMVRMLMGLVRPTTGSATVAGFDIDQQPRDLSSLRARAGLLTETPGFYDRLSALENLALFGGLYRIAARRLSERIEELLTALGLWDRRHDIVATYSKGMKQKLAVVRAIFHDPAVIFFDEPTAGLDPESALVVRRMIASLKSDGRTLVVCTHNLFEASELADVVAVIRSRLLAFGPPDTLGRDPDVPRARIAISGDVEAAAVVARSVAGVVSVSRAGADLELELEDPEREIPAVISALVQRGFGIRAARIVERSLEDIYLEAVGVDR
jgi:ABC-2 type transport system ATP-binding protein